jgi:hypothetical protein
MAAFQLPQFIESGEKILGPLNLRQFGYALGTFLFCAIVFTVFQAAVPSLGTYAIVPCIPFAALGGYIAFGKYNGRDTEIYVLKYFIYNFKPRTMVYTRVPEMTDIFEKESKLNVKSIEAEWAGRVAQTHKEETDITATFDRKDRVSKASDIRNLSHLIDSTKSSAFAEVEEKRIRIEQNEFLIQTKQRGAAGPGPAVHGKYDPSQLVPVAAAPLPYDPLDPYVEDNFFTEPKNYDI